MRQVRESAIARGDKLSDVAAVANIESRIDNNNIIMMPEIIFKSKQQ